MATQIHCPKCKLRIATIRGDALTVHPKGGVALKIKDIQSNVGYVACPECQTEFPVDRAQFMGVAPVYPPETPRPWQLHRRQ